MSQLTNKPLSVSEIISHSIKYCCSSFGKVWFYAFIIALMIFIIKVAIYFPAANAHTAVFIGIFATIGILIGLILGIATYGGLVLKINDFLHGHKHKVSGNRLRAGLGFFWPILAAVILAYLSIAIGFVLFALPGIFLMIALYIYLPLMITENRGPLCAYRESVILTWGNWWRTFVVLLFAILCYMISYGIISIILHLVAKHLLLSVLGFHPMILGAITHLLLTSLFLPWFTIIALVLLNDFKLRDKVKS